ncbi:RagB/SusD family nutrient uptake outer membrane protein [Lewinella sp. IMCC34183]|uniref:RagB/SusD family nutrient uptake outer membrane protein n=1 Tax=Lewinella sp. IMCC34183 TaxID=2248762 RepID=UPI000E24AEA0|nr:RagB/SusD family nutrient uptake outer membrane protein [Lewinella sp. IMCC34183]
MSILYTTGYRLLTVVAASCVLLFSACNDDFLNTEPLNSISSQATWGDGPLSEAFVFNVYAFLGRGGFDEQMLASLTDEALFTHPGRRIDIFNEGNEAPDNIAWTNYTYNYGNMYSAIRQANIALQELPTSTFQDDNLRDRLMGEAHFLRAYYYHQLARFYGGVPIIREPYGLNEDYSIARSSWEETVNFILEDLDQAMTLLEGKATARGRASTLSAMALKARVLLYAASDQYNAEKLRAAAPAMANYSDIGLVAYTSGDQQARWRAARDAALAVMDATNGYKLDLTAPVSPEEGTLNTVSIAMGGGSAAPGVDALGASELIFERSVASTYNETLFGMFNGPNGYHNWAGNTPIGALVDDFEMMDGTPFDWDDEEQATNPYENRDPRFYANILYDGAEWKPRPADVAGRDPYGEIQTGAYDSGNQNDAGETIYIAGLDTRESSVEDWNGSRTHYYTRKFANPDPAILDNLSSFNTVPWPFIRYTEMVLNYIEASMELGEEDEARAWLNRIRYRAGMPEITETGDDLMDRYRNERRLELAFEEHRYHDVRRWLIAEETQGRPLRGVDVTADLLPGKTAHEPYYYDPETYEYTYRPVNVPEENRMWNDKMFYRPIPRGEINRNELLIQNPGY